MRQWIEKNDEGSWRVSSVYRSDEDPTSNPQRSRGRQCRPGGGGENGTHSVDGRVIAVFPIPRHEKIGNLNKGIAFNQFTLLLLLWLLLLCVYTCICVHLYIPQHVCGDQRATCWSQFFSSTVWVLGFSTQVSALMVRSFIYKLAQR